MRRIVSILAVFATVVLISGMVRAADQEIRYEVELIRGSNSDQAPESTSRHAPAELVSTFRGVLKWRNYWEICRRNVAVSPNRKVRVQLRNGREVEIDLTTTNKRTVTAFQNGQIVDRSVGPRGEAVTLIGGDRDRASVWFIAVRRHHSEAPQGI